VRVILKPSELSVHFMNPAYVLNLRGQDIPYNPLFHAYLFIGLDRTVLFTEGVKVNDEVAAYLESLDVERKEYNDLWSFLRRREWGEGKVWLFLVSLGLWDLKSIIRFSFLRKPPMRSPLCSLISDTPWHLRFWMRSWPLRIL
jgi:hypothetical protein